MKVGSRSQQINNHNRCYPQNSKGNHLTLKNAPIDNNFDNSKTRSSNQNHSEESAKFNNSYSADDIVRAYVGQYVKFDVKVGGTPAPTIEWYYLDDRDTIRGNNANIKMLHSDIVQNMVPISRSTRHKMIDRGGTHQETGKMNREGDDIGGKYHSLIIGPLEIGDTGYYICTVTNRNGQASAPIKLFVSKQTGNNTNKKDDQISRGIGTSTTRRQQFEQTFNPYELKDHQQSSKLYTSGTNSSGCGPNLTDNNNNYRYCYSNGNSILVEPTYTNQQQLEPPSTRTTNIPKSTGNEFLSWSIFENGGEAFESAFPNNQEISIQGIQQNQSRVDHQQQQPFNLYENTTEENHFGFSPVRKSREDHEKTQHHQLIHSQPLEHQEDPSMRYDSARYAVTKSTCTAETKVKSAADSKNPNNGSGNKTVVRIGIKKGGHDRVHREDYDDHEEHYIYDNNDRSMINNGRYYDKTDRYFQPATTRPKSCNKNHYILTEDESTSRKRNLYNNKQEISNGARRKPVTYFSEDEDRYRYYDASSYDTNAIFAEGSPLKRGKNENMQNKTNRGGIRSVKIRTDDNLGSEGESRVNRHNKKYTAGEESISSESCWQDEWKDFNYVKDHRNNPNLNYRNLAGNNREFLVGNNRKNDGQKGIQRRSVVSAERRGARYFTDSSIQGIPSTLPRDGGRVGGEHLEGKEEHFTAYQQKYIRGGENVTQNSVRLSPRHKSVDPYSTRVLLQSDLEGGRKCKYRTGRKQFDGHHIAPSSTKYIDVCSQTDIESADATILRDPGTRYGPRDNNQFFATSYNLEGSDNEIMDAQEGGPQFLNYTAEAIHPNKFQSKSGNLPPVKYSENQYSFDSCRQSVHDSYGGPTSYHPQATADYNRSHYATEVGIGINREGEDAEEEEGQWPRLVEAQAFQKIPKEAPEFIKSFPPYTKSLEGKRVRFQAAVKPENDPSLKIDWYKDGKPMPVGARHNINYKDGKLALDIDPSARGDTGSYKCDLHNVKGTATSSFDFECEVEKPVQVKRVDPQELYRKHLGLISPAPVPPVRSPSPSTLYSYEKKNRETIPSKYPPPRFISHFSPIQVHEEVSAHFEARYEPSSDPNLKCEWYKDGAPLKISPRIIKKHENGIVVLNIDPVYQSDTGMYSCEISNSVGMDRTQASLICQSAKPIIIPGIEPQISHTNSQIDYGGPAQITQTSPPVVPMPMFMGGTKQFKVPISSPLPQQLSHLKNQQQTTPIDDGPKSPLPLYHYDQPYLEESKITFPPVKFTTHLQPIVGLVEQNVAHFEATYEPKEDPDVQIEWFKDGQPLLISSRIIRKMGSGHVVLDINSAFPSDSGIYTCVLTNKTGTDISETFLDCHVEKPIRLLESLEATFKPTQTSLPSSAVPIAPPVQSTRMPIILPGSQQQILPTPFFGSNNIQMPSVPTGPKALQAGYHHPFPYSPPIAGLQNEGSDPGVQIPVPVYQYEHQGYVPPMPFPPPKFLCPFQSIANLKEGHKTHFEARLEPKDDPSLNVEWLFNGKPIIIGSRHHYINDFGFVALDIYPTYAEDSGTYTCIATNRSGQADNSASLSCYGGASVITHSDNPDSLNKIRQLEKYQEINFQHPLIRGEDPSQKNYGMPVLMTKPGDLIVQQAERAHFEASFSPVDDPSIKCDWYFNGQPLRAGSRFKTIKDFGFLGLDVTDCLPEDAGIYTVVLQNANGYVTHDVSLTVIGDRSIDYKSLNPEGLMKIKALENQMMGRKTDHNLEQPEYESYPPRFISPFQDVGNAVDGDSIHFEAKYVPDKDPTLKVAWYLNGQPLIAGSRFRTMTGLGIIALDIEKVSASDNGIYECRITNKYGEDSTKALLNCTGSLLVDKQAINPESLRVIQNLETYQARIQDEERMKSLRDPSIPGKSPKFLTGFEEQITLNPNDNLVLEARFEPKDDPDLIIEWYHNSQPLTNSSRISPINNFGYVALKIVPLIQEDSGVYVCRAVNNYGEDAISTNVSLSSERLILTETLNPESLQGVRKLEAFMGTGPHKVNVGMTDASLGYGQEFPRFIDQFGRLSLKEGDTALFRARIVPERDSTLETDWFLNGQPLIFGDRHKLLNDFGYVGLIIKDISSKDNGTYTCKVSNKAGEAFMEGQIDCSEETTIQTSTLNPESLSAIHRLENITSFLPKPSETTESSKFGPPRFIKPINGNFTDLKENSSVRLEAFYEPFEDPTMKTYVLKDGSPILTGSRFRLVNEFGIIFLEISQLNPYDSGLYEFILQNQYGNAVTQALVTCKADKSVQEASLNPNALKKINRLEEWESSIFKRGFDALENGEYTYPPPLFLQDFPPQINLYEGQRLHIETRIEPKDDPSIDVEWFVNGNPLPAGDRFKTFRDFGLVSLDILTIYPEDSGLYTCKLKNKQGFSELKTQIICQPSAKIIKQSQLPQGTKDIDALEAHMNAKFLAMEVNEPVSEEIPVFTKQFVDRTVKEGQRVWFEGKLNPVRDQNMKILWLKDGKPLIASNRINIINDFGFIALEINSVVEEDQGEYSCVASNSLGQAVTSAQLICKSIPKIISDSQFARSEMLSESIDQSTSSIYDNIPENTSIEIPKFIQPLPPQLVIQEDSNVVFEIQIDPPTDPNRIVKWYKDEEEINASNRINIVCDFGFVALYIKGVRVDDTGLYTCRAINPLGEVMTSSTLLVPGTENISHDSMMPDPDTTLAKIRNLETWESINAKNGGGGRSKLNQRLIQRQLKQSSAAGGGRPQSNEGNIRNSNNYNNKTRNNPTKS